MSARIFLLLSLILLCPALTRAACIPRTRRPNTSAKPNVSAEESPESSRTTTVHTTSNSARILRIVPLLWSFSPKICGTSAIYANYEASSSKFTAT